MMNIVTIEQAKAVIALFADPSNGVVKVEDKLGGARHQARLASKIAMDGTPFESAVKYVTDSPAQLFVVNVTVKGTRGRAKTPVPDTMYAAFYTKDAILQGLNKRGPVFNVHTNCVTFYKVGELAMGQTFGQPICAIKCPFALKDIPADNKRPQAPYAKFWENFLSATFGAHNVANLKNSRYDMRFEFVNKD